MTFGREAQYVGDLQLQQKRSGSQKKVEKLVNYIPDVLDNITNLEEGLQKAFDAHENYDTFQNTKNFRTDARNVVIIFTDGKTHHSSKLDFLTKVLWVWLWTFLTSAIRSIDLRDSIDNLELYNLMEFSVFVKSAGRLAH